VRFSAILAFFFIFCSRLSALISVLCDILTVELAATDPPLLTTAAVNLAAPETTGADLPPDFCDDASVFPSVADRAAEKAPPLPQTVEEELLVSALVKVGRLFVIDPSDLDFGRSGRLEVELVTVEDRLLRFLARLARPTRPLPGSAVSFTTVG